MPYLIETHSNEKAREFAARRPPFGPGFAPAIIEAISTVTVEGSSFNDPGRDWVRFTARNSFGEVLSVKTVSGY